jgi:hypothetical protein
MWNRSIRIHFFVKFVEINTRFDVTPAEPDTKSSSGGSIVEMWNQGQ